MDPISTLPPRSQPQTPAPLLQAARELEALFLAEMLKSAGFGEPPEVMNGGVGEDQFASLLRTEHARALANAGGIGLAEQIFESMTRGQSND